MNRARIFSYAAVAAVVSASVAGLSLVNQQSASAVLTKKVDQASGSYNVDPVHSCVIFKVKHFGLSNFYGRFNDVSGTFSLGDTANVNVTVKAESVDTNNAQRDQHARSPDFLDAKEFPDITFTAKDVAKKGDSTYEGQGEMHFHGVTKPVTFSLHLTGTGKSPMTGGPAVGVESTITIKRSDFNAGKNPKMLGDDVQLMISLEGTAAS